MRTKLKTKRKILVSALVVLFIVSVYHSNLNTEPSESHSISFVHATPMYVSSSSDLGWFTHVVVLVSGKAGSGDTPMDLTLEIYDNGILVESKYETGISLGIVYTISLELGSANGNAAGKDFNGHSVQGKLTLSNPKGSVSYETDIVEFNIGQVPWGEVT